MLFAPARINRSFDLFDDFFNDPFFTVSPGKSFDSMMKTDIQDNDSDYLLEVELPGFRKEDIKAELKDGYLTISAAREENKEEKDKNNKFVRRERFTGSCRRSFYVGESITQEDMKAAFENGILKIQFPKEAPKAIDDSPAYIPIEG